MSRSRTTASLLLLLVAIAAQPSRAQQAQRGGQVIAGLSVQWQAALAGAFRLFAAEENPQPDCFSVYASVEGGALLVNFTPGRPLPEDAHLRGGRTSCGRDVSFLMSREGRLLRKTYSR